MCSHEGERRPAMNRREFVALFGFVTLAPFGAHGQQAMPVVGFLNSRSLRDTELLLSGLRKGMEETGFVEGQNIFIEYRWADGQYERLPAFAAELVSRPVTILVATGGEPVAFAAKAATSTIPVVFVVGGDPVKLGLVTSYPRPGGNVTGISIVTSEIAAKRLGLMHDLLPDAKR